MLLNNFYLYFFLYPDKKNICNVNFGIHFYQYFLICYLNLMIFQVIEYKFDVDKSM